MKKIFFAGISLLLLASASAVITPSVWRLLNAEQTGSIELTVQYLLGAVSRGIPGPQEVSGVGFEVEVSRDPSTGALTPGQRTLQTLKVKKLTRPFVELGSVTSNRTSALENDRKIWDWAMQVYRGENIPGIRKTINVIHTRGEGGTESAVVYELKNSWSNSWQLDPFVQGQQGPMTETYSFVYEDINRTLG